MFVPVNFKSPLLYNNLPKDFYILFFTFAAVIGFRFLSWYIWSQRKAKSTKFTEKQVLCYYLLYY